MLEDLEVSRANPGAGYLQRLFFRFNERVPFESASKIVRDHRVSDRQNKPRRPDVFWRERLESGTGGTCFARVAAFDALISGLGFATRRLLGRVLADYDHAGLLVSVGGEDFLCDVGFPLPGLLPAREGRTETALATAAVSPTPRGWSVELEGGVPEGPRSLELFDAEVCEEEFAARWERTFRPESKFLREVVLRRSLENRVVSFAGGEARVDDLHSRTRIPLPAPRAAAVSELFGVDASVLEESFARAGDPEPEGPDARIEVFLEAPVGAEASFHAIASPGGYARLHEGVAGVACEATGPRSWKALLSLPSEPDRPAPAADPLEERVSADDAFRTLSVQRGTQRSSWDVEERLGRVWLIRRLILNGPRPDLLRNDSLRGRLAGTLALDLLAWARLLG
ncbi:MAG: arylamine N-acetyltransferase [Acidobacteria bacterium]|nr:arylamine N-acetyltransferase [Acidobacteriota bacterium]MCA1611180.1 arylamine N-acetyltransferase [Acidobacteriota bacterium]